MEYRKVGKYICNYCRKRFSRQYNLRRHLSDVHKVYIKPNDSSILKDEYGSAFPYSANTKQVRDSQSGFGSVFRNAEMTNGLLVEDYDSLKGENGLTEEDYRQLREAEDFDYGLKAPFTMVVSGMTQSGKSTLTADLLKRRDEIIESSRPIRNVCYCYSEYQHKLFVDLQSHIPGIRFHNGLPEDFEEFSDGIVVLDDLMSEASKSEDVCAAFTRKSHHHNICLIILVQNFFHKNLRNITTNCHYLCIMKNPRDSSFLGCLGRQMNGGRKNAVLEGAYEECVSSPYGYVFIDATQQQNDKHRVRDCIFPEGCTVYTKK